MNTASLPIVIGWMTDTRATVNKAVEDVAAEPSVEPDIIASAQHCHFSGHESWHAVPTATTVTPI